MKVIQIPPSRLKRKSLTREHAIFASARVHPCAFSNRKSQTFSRSERPVRWTDSQTKRPEAMTVDLHSAARRITE
jgi:hypothetical protein